MTRFKVGHHEVRTWQEGGAWAVAVDRVVHHLRFRTETLAAGVGLLRAQQLDHPGRTHGRRPGAAHGPHPSHAA